MAETGARVPDLAAVAARFGAELRAEGVPVGPERSERFARAVLVARPQTTRTLYWCAMASLVSDPAEVPALDRVFARVFGEDRQAELVAAGVVAGPGPRGRPEVVADERGDSEPRSSRPPQTESYPALAATAERLARKDFAELTEAELAELAVLMRRLRPAPPPRRSRRTVVAARGPAMDLRATLRHARRTAGHPVRLRRRRHRRRPRKLVVLCDISGSMAPYARAILRLLLGTAGGARGKVFTFATRLTRLSRDLRRLPPAAALARVGELAPDWSGGTRIGECLREFVETYGARGMARGAVVVIVSDGWDTGDPAVLGAQMRRLSRLAYRIVWANPRTASPRYQPLAGGMAAAWPYCDAVVSAHHLAALDELIAAIGAVRGERTRPPVVAEGEVVRRA